MNEYLVLALDGLLYLAGYGVLVALTWGCAKLFYRGHFRAGWMTAALCVFIVAVAKNVLDSRAGAWLPTLTPYEQMAAGAGAVFIAACPVVWWRFSISWLSAAPTALVLVAALYGASFGLPAISERVLPPGMRMAQFLDSAYTRTREAREAAAKFKTVNEDATHMMAAALHTLADLSSKQEFEALKKEFSNGVKLYAERKAAWDAMTPEERAENRKALKEFMQEQGISEDRYSLSALKHASMDDVKNLVAFMKEMQASMPSDAAAGVPQKIRPPEESLQIFLRNIRGMEFSKEDHEAMATFSKIFCAKGLDATIAETRTELVTQKLNPEWAGTFLAAMLETKTGMPVTTILSEPEPISAPIEAAALIAPTAPVIRMISLPLKFGYLRVPRGTKDVDELSAAAETIPVTGLLKGGDRVRVALGNKSIGLGEVYKVSRGAQIYAFRVEEVSEGLVHLTNVSLQ